VEEMVVEATAAEPALQHHNNFSFWFPCLVMPGDDRSPENYKQLFRLNNLWSDFLRLPRMLDSHTSLHLNVYKT
jgi:hypothetical protein